LCSIAVSRRDFFSSGLGAKIASEAVAAKIVAEVGKRTGGTLRG
jgi:hypothetical protein